MDKNYCYNSPSSQRIIDIRKNEDINATNICKNSINNNKSDLNFRQNYLAEQQRTIPQNDHSQNQDDSQNDEQKSAAPVDHNLQKKQNEMKNLSNNFNNVEDYESYQKKADEMAEETLQKYNLTQYLYYINALVLLILMLYQSIVLLINIRLEYLVYTFCAFIVFFFPLLPNYRAKDEKKIFYLVGFVIYVALGLCSIYIHSKIQDISICDYTIQENTIIQGIIEDLNDKSSAENQICNDSDTQIKDQIKNLLLNICLGREDNCRPNNIWRDSEQLSNDIYEKFFQTQQTQEIQIALVVLLFLHSFLMIRWYVILVRNVIPIHQIYNLELEDQQNQNDQIVEKEFDQQTNKNYQRNNNSEKETNLFEIEKSINLKNRSKNKAKKKFSSIQVPNND